MTKTDIIVQAAVTNGTTSKVILNLPKILSSYNRRGMVNVDDRGHAQLYTVSASLVGTNANGAIIAAPNCYYTKRAVKDWHDAWVRRLRKAGISREDLGPYMKTLRPYLNRAHFSSATSTSISGVTAVKELDEEVFTWATDNTSGVKEGLAQTWAGEEWTYTEIIHTNPAPDNTNALTANRTIGEYFLTLLDQDANADGTGYDRHTAGMIYSWLGSFTQTPTPTEAETIQTQNADVENALHALRDSDLSGGELSEMAAESVQEKAPWDRDGSSYYAGSISGGVMAARGGSSNTIIAEAPCGLMQLNIDNDDNGTQVVYVNLEVLSIEDM